MKQRILSRLAFGLFLSWLIGSGLPAAAGTQEFTGELTRDDRQLEGGEFADYLRIDLKAGQMLTVTVRSNDFDTWIQLTAPNNENITNDDIAEDDTDSQLKFLVPQDGSWVIWVSSAMPDQLGDYAITVSTVDTQVTSTVQGELGEGDQFSLKTGEWCDPYTFDLEPDQVLVVRLMSDEFDTYLAAYEGDNRYYSDDDFNRTQSVVMLFGGPEGARVTVVVTSYDDTGEGKYKIEYRELVPERAGR
ncbi:MAG: PPC domain-containing protein [Planctomycetota bacterium]